MWPRAAFGDILANDFTNFSPRHAQYPLGVLLALAVGIVPHVVDGDVEAAADRAVIGGLHIGIGPDITDNLRFV